MNTLSEDHKLSVTARQSFGVDIDAACGQLFAKYEKKAIKEKTESKQITP